MSDQSPKSRILIVDDEPEVCEVLSSHLARRGHTPIVHTTIENALEALKDEDIDLVITDLWLGEDNGLDICRAIEQMRPDIPSIVMTGRGDIQSVSQAMRAGAFDYVLKPFDLDALDAAILRAKESASVRAPHPLAGMLRSGDFDRLIGRSRAMRSVHELILRAAPTDATVFIAGESGTGKELVARAVQDASKRAGKPFIAVNCAAMPEALLESELFGHARGAFTDAKTGRRGLFAEAEGGTIFLDEISEMPLSMQVKLLRAIQERTVRPVGSSEEVKIDVRIIAATNRAIDSEVEAGRFRADLFYRLNVVRIDVPPLRQRKADIKDLVLRFISANGGDRVTSISAAALDKLLNYPFPGNVRELENIIGRACALTRGQEIELEDLPLNVREYEVIAPKDERINLTELWTMERVEKRYIGQVLAAMQGNKTHAAHVLQIDRKTLTRKLQRWKLAELRARALRSTKNG